MEELPAEISVLTLNCWGLKYISKLRRERMSEIGRQLAVANPQPHIVALQECWTQEDCRCKPKWFSPLSVHCLLSQGSRESVSAPETQRNFPKWRI